MFSIEPQRAPSPTGPEGIVAAIMDALAAGSLVPGQRLVEADLSLRFGVGRTQIREALHRLASDDVVELSRNKGATIKRRSSAEVSGAIDVMEVLVGLAARSAARAVRLGASTEELIEAVDGMVKIEASKDTQVLLQARRRVYQVLIGLAGNPDLERIVYSMQYHVLQNQVLWTRVHVEMNRGLHAVVQMILDGHDERAEALAREHIHQMQLG